MNRLYHATRPALLSLIAKEGIRSASGFSNFGRRTQVGVSTTTNFDVVAGGSFGNLILELDAQSLARQFSLYPYSHPSVEDEYEIRVVDETQDETVIPFSNVTAIYRIAPSLNRMDRELLQFGIPVYIVWKGIVRRVSKF